MLEENVTADLGAIAAMAADHIQNLLGAEAS